MAKHLILNEEIKVAGRWQTVLAKVEDSDDPERLVLTLGHATHTVGRDELVQWRRPVKT